MTSTSLSCKNLLSRWCSFLSLHPCMSSMRVMTEIFLRWSFSTVSTALEFPLKHQIKTSVSTSMEPRLSQSPHHIGDRLLLVFPHPNGGVAGQGLPIGFQGNWHDNSFNFTAAGQFHFLTPPKTLQNILRFISKIDNRCLHVSNDYFHQDILSSGRKGSVKDN